MSSIVIYYILSSSVLLTETMLHKSIPESTTVLSIPDQNCQPKKSSCSGQCIHWCPCSPQWPTHFNKCLYLLLSLAVVAVIAGDHHHGDVNTCHWSVCTHMAAVQEISYFVLGSHWACGAVPGMELVASCLQDRPSTTEPSRVTLFIMVNTA